jgi:[ribosomal protein S18]-alanine N-acetyltransferase
MKIIQYKQDYKNICLGLFDANTPQFFAPIERQKYSSFLDRQKAPFHYYLVDLGDDEIIACGGIKIEEEINRAMIRWDIVEPSWQNKKVGSFLTKYRIAVICQKPEINRIFLGTTQLTFGFYEKLGFKVLSIEKDGIASGLDRYLMELEITEPIRNTSMANLSA